MNFHHTNSCVVRFNSILAISFLIVGLSVVRMPSLIAQNAGLENRLSRALKLFPDADTDKDGTLTLPEALKYVETHPELQSLLGTKVDTANDAKRMSSAPPSLTTSDSIGLPAGPCVFVCAHSFMIYTATLLPPLAEAAGIAYQDAGKQMLGGSRVIQHWNLPDEKNRAKAALQDGKVDVLMLSPHMLLPDEGIDNFVKLGLEKNPKLRILIQASWPGRDGEVSKDFTNEKRDESTQESLHKMHDSFHETWFKSLESQVRSLNASVGHDAVFIVPVCDAVLALREHIAAGTAPGLSKQTDIFRDPLGHPKPPLASLVTYCHFAAIFNRTPIGLAVPAELKSNAKAEELNRLLQQIAWGAVTNYPMSGVKAENVSSSTR